MKSFCIYFIGVQREAGLSGVNPSFVIVSPGFRSRKGNKKTPFALFAPLFTPLNIILWSAAGGFNRGGSKFR
jgi:hypothetical protein